MGPIPAVVGVVPCAGASRRMGAAKALLDADGAPFLVRAVEALRNGGCDPVLVVLPSEGSGEEERLATAAGARVLRNPEPGDGPLSSLQLALASPAFQGAGEAALLVLPVDHPGVRASTVRALVEEAGEAPGAEVVLPRFGDRRGHPTLFRGRALAELRDPGLAQGARTVVRRDSSRVLEVPVDDPAVIQDLDEPVEYRRWYGDVVDPARAADLVLQGLEERLVTVVVTRLATHPPERRVWTFRDEDLRRAVGRFSDPSLDRDAEMLARRAGRDPDRSGKAELCGETVYLERHAPQPELVIVGAGHIARPLSTAAALAGFRVVVADDRPGFATRERFPDAHRVMPFDFDDPFRGLTVDGHTHVVLVTRGHKFDYECLRTLLRRETRAGYVGMIGSRRRVRATWEQLLAEGVPRDRIESVRAPLGLDVGAVTPGEIALAVAAELVLVRRGGTGAPLRDRERVMERFFPRADEVGT